MASIDEANPFTSYELSLEERAAGYSLTPEQILVIKNDIAQAAIQKLSLKFDPANPHDFLQREAELQGRILILQHMILRSQSAAYELTNEVLETLEDPE